MSKSKQRIKVITASNVFALGVMHIVNQAISSSALLKNILKPGIGKYYSWKLGDIFYQKSGSGSPLLLIHDLNPASSGYEWNQLEEKLRKDHTLYTIDLLGCGRSDKPALTYTNFLYVQLISDFVKEIIGKKTDVVVTGLSSTFVVMASYADKNLFNRILMINPVSLKKLEQVPNRKSKILKRMMCVPIISTALYYIEMSRQNIEYILTEKYIYNPFRIQAKYTDAYYEASHYKHGNGKYLKACLDGFYLNADIRTPLAKIDNEMQIIYGEKLDFEKEISEGYRKINSSISTISLYGTKFLPQLETPEEIFHKIERFMS